MGQFVVRIDQFGRVVIPAPLRRRLGLVEGSEVILTSQQDALLMRTRRHAIAAAQKYFTKLAPAEELWSEDLIRDRRQEAQREHGPEYVLDASALIALVRREPGWEEVADIIDWSTISAVSLAEAAAKRIQKGGA